jgi:hypothetical protein
MDDAQPMVDEQPKTDAPLDDPQLRKAIEFLQQKLRTQATTPAKA